MKFFRSMLLTCLFLLFTASLAAQAPRRELAGTVFHLGGNGQQVFERGVAASLEVSGASTLTNDAGFFRLPIPSYFNAGEVVRLNVAKEGWRVRYPLDGELRIPAEPHKELVRIELLPAGSKLFWTNDRIEKFVQDELQRTAAQLSHNRETRQEFEARQELSFSRSLREWSQRYGLSAHDARTEIDRWIADVQKNAGEDERRLGLALFAQKEFSKAAEHFAFAAKARADQIESIQRERDTLAAKEIDLRREAAHDYRLEGSAYYNDWRFQEAIVAYQNALAYLKSDEDARERAALEDSLGLALTEQGTRAAGEDSVHYLEQAEVILNSALRVRNCEQLPQDWASTQDNLGRALWARAILKMGDESLRLLEEAVTAYRRALEVRTREALPQAWASTQNNLGLALKDQAIRTTGEESSRLLAEAVATFRSSLEVRTRETVPQEWALTSTNLGSAFFWQATQSLGRTSHGFLNEALSTSRQALAVFTRENLPQRWAGVQTRNGIYLMEMAIRTPGEESIRLLRESVAAFTRAFEVHTRTDLP